MEGEADDDFRSAGEASDPDAEEDSSEGAPEGDGEVDDLEYLTLDLVNVLPPESCRRLLDLLRRREGQAMDMTRQNSELRAEVRALRHQVAASASAAGSSEAPSPAKSTAASEASPAKARAAASPGAPCGEGDCASVPSLPSRAAVSALSTAEGAEPSELTALQRRAAAHARRSRAAPDPAQEAELLDLKERISAFLAERRSGGAERDALDEDVEEAAKESLQFLGDAKQMARVESLPRVLATLAQWLSWVAQPELAPRGAAQLLARVPDEALQRAFAVARAHAETRPRASALSELPDCTPHALRALDALPDDSQSQRVGLACLALAALGAAGRRALVEEGCTGLRAAMAAAARRPKHPEVQAWVLAALAACAPDLPRDADGAKIAWEGVGVCAGAFRHFRIGPLVREHAAHALAGLLRAFPRRIAAAAASKRMRESLAEAESAAAAAAAISSPAEAAAAEPYRASLAAALSELERASALAAAGRRATPPVEAKPCGEGSRPRAPAAGGVGRAGG